MRKSKCKKTKISELMNHPNTMEIHNLSLSPMTDREAILALRPKITLAL